MFLAQTRLSIGNATEPVWTGTVSDTSGHHEADLHRQQSIRFRHHRETHQKGINQ